MDVPIQHVIGTVALIALLIAGGLAYTAVTSYIEAEAAKRQLDQIAEYVALNLVELVSLVNYANFLNNKTMMKLINLPSDIGGKAYSITLINETTQGKGCYVQASLVVRKDVAVSSPIPLNSSQTQLRLATDDEGVLLVGWRRTDTIQYRGTVYGGTQDTVVWGWRKDDNTTWAGIGVEKFQGGG